MKLNTFVTALVTTCAVVALATAAWALPGTAGPHGKAVRADTKVDTGSCVMCPMKKSGADGESMACPDSMKTQAKVLMNTKLSPEDPEAMLALRDSLNLTPAQVKKLRSIIHDSRTQARQVLTADQQATLKTMPQEPVSMAALHKEMHQKGMNSDKNMGMGKEMMKMDKTRTN